MNKSLLSLLQEEHRLLNSLECSREAANAKRDWLNKAEQEGLANTTVYQLDLGLLKIYEMDCLQSKIELSKIRKEIKKYFAFLETL